jgi:hypothetical protein
MKGAETPFCEKPGRQLVRQNHENSLFDKQNLLLQALQWLKAITGLCK